MTLDQMMSTLDAAKTPYQVAEAAAKLRDLGIKQRVIARRVGKGDAWLSRLLGSYDQAIPELRQLWRRGAVSMETALTTARLTTEEQLAVCAPAPGTKRAEPPKPVERPGAYDLRHTIAAYVKARRKLPPYVQGMYDALRFAAGDPVTFDREWNRVKMIARRLEK